MEVEAVAVQTLVPQGALRLVVTCPHLALEANEEAEDEALLKTAITEANAERAATEAGLQGLIPAAQAAIKRLKSACKCGGAFQIVLSSHAGKCYCCGLSRASSLATRCKAKKCQRIACLPCAGELLRATMAQELDSDSEQKALARQSLCWNC